MHTLTTLYPYLTEGELRGRFEEGVRILLKIGRFSHKIAAGKSILTGVQNGDREWLNFFGQYKREKAPLYKTLKNMKAIHAAMPTNSKLTVKL